MANIQEVMTLLHQVHQGDPGWRTQWQRACEILWTGLSMHPAIEIDEHVLNSFIGLLLDPDRFSIARLVIADFRKMDIITTGTSAQKQRVVDATEQIRATLIRQEAFSQGEADDILYTVEKRIMLESEMHRARVLLHHSGAFGPEGEEEIRAWLEKRPAMLGAKDTEQRR